MRLKNVEQKSPLPHPSHYINSWRYRFNKFVTAGNCGNFQHDLNSQIDLIIAKGIDRLEFSVYSYFCHPLFLTWSFHFLFRIYVLFRSVVCVFRFRFIFWYDYLFLIFLLKRRKTVKSIYPERIKY